MNKEEWIRDIIRENDKKELEYKMMVKKHEAREMAINTFVDYMAKRNEIMVMAMFGFGNKYE